MHVTVDSIKVVKSCTITLDGRFSAVWLVAWPSEHESRVAVCRTVELILMRAALIDIG